MKYQTRFARITNFGKLADRFLTCQINQPTSPELSSRGSLYILLEINNPWLTSAQIGQTIINTLLRFYYKGEDSSNLINFENTLKKVNEALAQMTQNGETDWIGNLNAVIILNAGSELHISQTGHTTAFLLRNNTVSDLTFDTDNNETHPLKTFSNIASGTLEPKDKIFISNNQVNHIIPREKLENLLGESSPKFALFELAKILKKQRVKTVNSIILEAMADENAPFEDLPETIYLDQPLESYLVTTKKYYNSYIKPASEKIAHLIKKGSLKSFEFTKKTIVPAIQKISKSTGKKLSEATSSASKKISPTITHFSEKVKEKTPEVPISRYKISHYAESKFKKTFKSLIRWLIDHPKYMYGIGAVLLILIAACLIGNRSQKTDQNSSGNDTTAKKIEEMLASANKYAAFNEKDKAIETLSGAKELINSDKTLSTDTQADLNKKVNDILYKQISAQTLTLVNPQNYVGANKIFIYNNKAIGFNSSTNSLIEPNLKNEPVAKQIFSSSQSEEKVLYYDNQDTIYIENGLNELYSYDLKKSESTKISASSGWVQAIGIIKYGKNFYFLDNAKDNLIKYTQKDETNYGDAFNYITDKTALADPVSLDIDGKIYILQKNGDVFQFASGKKTDFKLSGLPVPYNQIVSPYRIITPDNGSDMYIIDLGEKGTLSARIINFDKNGNFKKQYFLPENIQNIQDIVIKPESKKVWILADSKVQEADLSD